jgi:hypothetical protein
LEFQNLIHYTPEVEAASPSGNNGEGEEHVVAAAFHRTCP